MSEIELRKLPVDLDSIVEIATESEFYDDDSIARTGYVDTMTGEVHIIYREELMCANGELDPEDLQDYDEERIQIAIRAFVEKDASLVEIERWHSSEVFALMEEFADAATNPRVKSALLDALNGKKPFRRFKDTLFEWPEVRQAWFSFEGHSQRARARKWLRHFAIDAEDASGPKLAPLSERW